MKGTFIIPLSILSATLLSGCMLAGTPTTIAIQTLNADFKRQYDPIRLVERPLDKRSTITTAEWAGTPGVSITEYYPQVKADTFSALQENCGLTEEQLAEVRIVQYKPPVFNEVFVFNDEKSERKDKTTGISIVFKQLPNNGGVDILFYGSCHSKEMPSLITNR